MTEIVAAFLTGVAGPVILLMAKSYINSKKQARDMILDAVEVGSLVSSKIDEIKEEFNADRVWVAQFHNGGHFYPTGKSIAKFSIFYEAVKPGILSIQSEFQNIPVNLFARVVNELLDNDTVSIPDFKDETIPTFGLKYIADNTGCKSGYVFAIKTIDGKFIGILGIDYVKKKVKLDDESVHTLSHHAAAMGGVLMTHLQLK